MAQIYLATNKINGKQYVGMTKYLMEDRKAAHEEAAARGTGFVFQRAIKKYGPDMFDWRVLFEILNCNSESDISCLPIMEKFFICELGTLTPNGYNLAAGGEGLSLVGESGEYIRAKASASRKHWWASLSAGEKADLVRSLSISQKKRWNSFSAEERAEMISTMLTARKDTWESYSESEKEDLKVRKIAAHSTLKARINIVSGAQKRWADKSPEEKFDFYAWLSKIAWAKRRDTGYALPEEVIQSIAKKSREWWESVGEEYKKARSQHMSKKTSNWWASMSAEERQAFISRRAIAIKQGWQNKNSKEGEPNG